MGARICRSADSRIQVKRSRSGIGGEDTGDILPDPASSQGVIRRLICHRAAENHILVTRRDCSAPRVITPKLQHVRFPCCKIFQRQRSRRGRICVNTTSNELLVIRGQRAEIGSGTVEGRKNISKPCWSKIHIATCGCLRGESHPVHGHRCSVITIGVLKRTRINHIEVRKSARSGGRQERRHRDPRDVPHLNAINLRADARRGTARLHGKTLRGCVRNERAYDVLPRATARRWVDEIVLQVDSITPYRGDVCIPQVFVTSRDVATVIHPHLNSVSPSHGKTVESDRDAPPCVVKPVGYQPLTRGCQSIVKSSGSVVPIPGGAEARKSNIRVSTQCRDRRKSNAIDRGAARNKRVRVGQGALGKDISIPRGSDHTGGRKGNRSG